MIYYINDTTYSPSKVVEFKSVPDIVKYLDGVCQRRFRLTRQQYMQNLIDLGYGFDDKEGVTFTQALAEHFNIGVMDGSRFIRTNIHEADRNRKYMAEYGN